MLDESWCVIFFTDNFFNLKPPDKMQSLNQSLRRSLLKHTWSWSILMFHLLFWDGIFLSFQLIEVEAFKERYTQDNITDNICFLKYMSKIKVDSQNVLRVCTRALRRNVMGHKLASFYYSWLNGEFHDHWVPHACDLVEYLNYA